MADQVPDVLRGWKQIADALGATEKTIRGWIADAADADERPPIFKVADAPQAPVMAERGELLRWLLRRARRYPVSEVHASDLDGDTRTLKGAAVALGKP